MKKLTIYLGDLVHDFEETGNFVVPLNIGTIAAHLNNIFKKEIEITLFKSPNQLIDKIKTSPPDLLGLSNYIWNFELNKVVLSAAKKINKSTITIVGGPHVTYDNKGLSTYLKENREADIYVLFEGEVPFKNIIERVLSTKSKNIFNEPIDGCVYLKDDKLTRGASIPYLKGEITYPSPYLTGLLDPFLKKSFSPLFETNRGCPYSCSFCVWGIHELNKMRIFNMDRSIEEFKYVSKRFPNHLLWTFADANFGMLKRDIILSQKLREIADKWKNPKKILIWWSKNTIKRNMEISDILGDLSVPYVAFQSLDPLVLKHIDRSNIPLSNTKEMLDFYKEKGRKAKTDILLGLPMETKESHLNSLKEVLDYDFDVIKGANTIMLPSAPMASEESRKKYKIKTSFRLKEGSYGIYDGQNVAEFDEIVTSTSTMKKSELLSFRIIHWLIWLMWNIGYFKPILEYLKKNGVHPLDCMYACVNNVDDKRPNLKKIFKDFVEDTSAELFDSLEEVKDFYVNNDVKFNELYQGGGFSKLNFKYTAMFLLDEKLLSELFDYLKDVSKTFLSEKGISDFDVLEEIFEFSYKSIYVINKEIRKKEMVINPETFSFMKKLYKNASNMIDTESGITTASGGVTSAIKIKDNYDNYKVNFIYDPKQSEMLDFHLKKYKFESNKHKAVEKTLENTHLISFLRNIEFQPCDKKI